MSRARPLSSSGTCVSACPSSQILHNTQKNKTELYKIIKNKPEIK